MIRRCTRRAAAAMAVKQLRPQPSEQLRSGVGYSCVRLDTVPHALVQDLLLHAHPVRFGAESGDGARARRLVAPEEEEVDVFGVGARRAVFRPSRGWRILD